MPNLHVFGTNKVKFNAHFVWELVKDIIDTVMFSQVDVELNPTRD